MKQIRLVAIAMASGVALSFAAPAGAREFKSGKFGRGNLIEHVLGSDQTTTVVLKGMTKRLDLTEEQQLQIAPILERTRLEMRETAEGTRAVLEKSRDEIGAVLTPEQKAIIRDTRKHMAGAVKGFVRNHGPEIREKAHKVGDDFRTKMVLHRLDLTEEQRAKLKEIHESAREQREAIMNEVKPRLDEIRDSVKQEIDSVLTEEQRAELQKK